MNADVFPDEDCPLKRESEPIIGASYSALNALGHGLHGKIHENALAVELALQNTACGQIIVDTKTTDRITGLKLGLLLNFERAKLGIRRVAPSSHSSTICGYPSIISC
jgi:hypothetical protein